MGIFTPTALLTSLILLFLNATIINAGVIKALPPAKGNNNIPLPSSTLAGPSPDLKLRHVVLGLGHQNYTCSSSDASATPELGGALATLYDATSVLGVAIQRFGNVRATKLAGEASCATDAQNKVGGFLPELGKHYFTAEGVPSFDLYNGDGKPYFSAQKLATVDAPSDACKGRDGGKAVGWLQLKDDGTDRNRGGLTMAYRVQTVGGAADAKGLCQGKKPGEWVTRDYSAYYYFYGN
ncbi:MAG: hypothetical protein M1831_004807 [Alyxoria varia]|nr:MAG: hypothetical protein M1831_004807 [Alyxoria varia]